MTMPIMIFSQPFSKITFTKTLDSFLFDIETSKFWYDNHVVENVTSLGHISRNLTSFELKLLGKSF